MMFNKKINKILIKKLGISFSSNLTLLTFLMLFFIFFSFKYNLLVSLSLAFFWIIFLISKSSHYKIGILFLLFLISLISFYGQYFWFSFPIPQTINNRQFTIDSISDKYVILKHHRWKIIWWTDDRSLFPNQQIKIISSSVKAINGSENSYNFDFRNFLSTKYVYYQFDKIDWIIGKESWNPKFHFFKWLTQSEIHPLVKAFTWQQPTLLNLKSNLNELDWGYIWLLNSFALGFINKFWIFFQKHFYFLKRQSFNLIYGLIWFAYWYLLGFNLIIFRFLINFLFKSFNSGLNLKQQRLLTLISLSLLEPNYFLRLTSWFLIVPYLIWPTKKNLWYKKMALTWSLMIPLQIMLNYRVNLTSPFLLIIVAPIFALTHCLSFLLWWCPNFYLIWDFNFKILTQLILFISQISLFWNIGHVPLMFYIFYFFTLNYWLHGKKSLRLLILLTLEILFILTWNKIILPNESVFMLNVGNGNSFVYVNKFKNLVLIFDCGSGPGRTTSNMADFLKWHGLNHVDYLFISHFHEDHYNGLETVKNVVRVKQIITNETNVLQWNFKGLTVIGWRLNNMKDVNDGSLVLLFKTTQANLLFMGDLTKVGEKKLMAITDFNQIIRQMKIDWMQLGHHGSNNSTSFELLHLVNPSYVFISAGVKNNHSFPDFETINQLQKLGIKFVSTSDHLNWKFNLISHAIHSFH